MIIEKVSGRPYWEFVRERVFIPADMRETGPWGPDEVVANRAVGYTRTEGGGWRSNVYALPGRPSSAGGVESTAGDLLRFVSAIDSGKVAMSPAAGEPRRHALGIAGGTEGANAVIDSEGELTVIVLANVDPPAAERVAKRIRGWTPRTSGR